MDIISHAGTVVRGVVIAENAEFLQLADSHLRNIGHKIVTVPYVIAPRRSGDIAECYASTALAKKELGFECKYDLNDMCEDSWRWSHLRNIGHKIVGDTVGVFAYKSALMRPDWIEISKQGNIKRIVGFINIFE